jgi:hypothetical protein
MSKKEAILSLSSSLREGMRGAKANVDYYRAMLYALALLGNPTPLDATPTQHNPNLGSNLQHNSLASQRDSGVGRDCGFPNHPDGWGEYENSVNLLDLWQRYANKMEAPVSFKDFALANGLALCDIPPSLAGQMLSPKSVSWRPGGGGSESRSERGAGASEGGLSSLLKTLGVLVASGMFGLYLRNLYNERLDEKERRHYQAIDADIESTRERKSKRKAAEESERKRVAAIAKHNAEINEFLNPPARQYKDEADNGLPNSDGLAGDVDELVATIDGGDEQTILDLYSRYRDKYFP